jgi:hypothetical protein
MGKKALASYALGHGRAAATRRRDPRTLINGNSRA